MYMNRFICAILSYMFHIIAVYYPYGGVTLMWQKCMFMAMLIAEMMINHLTPKSMFNNLNKKSND